MKLARSLWIIQKFILCCLLASGAAQAQIVPDGTLGNERSRVTPIDAKSDRIEGGALRGVNLFHSFLEFNVGEGRGAYFANPTAVQNIFSRVTGSNLSRIDGTLGVLGNANLFLLNPNGIIFGPKAQLDVSGSFFASTANGFKFSDGSEFSATNPQEAPLLMVNLTPGLQRGGIAGAIANEGKLTVGKDLTLSGGTVMSTGQLSAPQGKLTVEATTGDTQVKNVTAQTATLYANNNLILEESQLRTTEDLNLLAQNTVRVRDSVANPFLTSAGGKLLVQGNQAVDIFALNNPASELVSGGDMVLRSANAVMGDAHYWSGGNFQIENLDQGLGGLSSPYDPVIRSAGDVSFAFYTGSSLHILAGGSVTINGIVSITADPPIGALQEVITLSDGVTKITIDGNAEPTLDIRAGTTAFGSPTGVSGVRANDQFRNEQFLPAPSSLTNQPTNADINLGIVGGKGVTVFLTNQYFRDETLSGGVIKAGIIGTGSDIGNGGSVTIDARRDITLLGIDSSSIAPSRNGGSINLIAGSNVFTSLNSKSSVTIGSAGNGGSISVRAGGVINLLGVDSSSSSNNGNSGNGGSIYFQAGDNILSLGDLKSSTLANNGNAGNGGFIFLQSSNSIGNPLLGALGNLDSSSSATGGTTGRGGGITLNASNSITANNFDSRSSSDRDSENGGFINLQSTTGTISTEKLQSGSTASAGNSGDGGRIDLKAPNGAITTKNLSSETSAANGISGNGGQIVLEAKNDITTENIVSSSSNLFGGNGGDISLTSTTGRTITNDISSKGSFPLSNAIPREGELGNITLNSYGDLIFTSHTIDATGNKLGGNIKLISRAGTISLKDGVIQSDDFGTGKGGDIQVQGNSVSLMNTNLITTSSGNRDGGTISITTPGSASFENSVISTSVARNGTGRAGDIQINAGSIPTFNGGGVSSTVMAAAKGDSGDIQVKTSSLSLSNGANLSSSTEGGVVGNAGKIEIQTGTFSATGSSQLTSFIGGEGNASKVTIEASGDVVFNGKSSGIFSVVNPEATGNSGDISITTPALLSLSSESGLFSQATGRGNSGNLTIQAGSLSITGSSQIGTGVSKGSGNSGDIVITTNKNILFDGYQSGVFSIVNSDANGNSGDISITTPTLLSLSNGARVFSAGDGKGNSGDLSINSGSLSVTGISQIATFINGRGRSGDVVIRVSGAVTLDGSEGNVPGGIVSRVNPGAVGQGGTIDVEAKSFSATNGAQLTTFLGGIGQAGDVRIKTTDNIIFANATGLLNSGIFSNVISGAVGNGGNIGLVSADGSLSLTDGAELSAKSSGQGNAGNISINARRSYQANNGTISTSSDRTSGGSLDVSTERIFLRGNSDIKTFVARGEGSGGSIRLASDLIIAFDDSDILAYAIDGRGGNITFDTPILLTFRYFPAPRGTDPSTLDDNGRVDINATGAISNGVITFPETDPSRGLTPLPTVPVDPSNQINTTCTPNSTRVESRFVSVGRGGLPTNPGDPLTATATFSRLATLDSPSTAPDRSTLPPSDRPLVEAQTWVKLPNGRIRLVSQIPNSPSSWQNTPGCHGQ